MSATGSVLQAGRIAFEVSRFEVVGERCQVEGRWVGVRGRRFMRPALTVVVDGKPIRLLADLADKPWAAEDGGPWKAMFPYTIEEGQSDQAELTVSPDLTITLPAPKRRGGAGRRKSASRRAPASRGTGVHATSSHALTLQLTELRDTERQLRAQLERLEADRAQAMQRLIDASRELREVSHEREESDAARHRITEELEVVKQELSQTAAERDAALQERDRLAADHDDVRRTHGETLRANQAVGVARDRAVTERGAALDGQRQAVSERDAAIVARDQAVAERDAALSLRDEAVAERDTAVSDHEALSRDAEQLQSQLADLASAHGAALVMRRAARAPAAGIGDRDRNIFARRTRSTVIPVAITIMIVLTILVVWVILLRGL
jgi:hypothetical protein